MLPCKLNPFPDTVIRRIPPIPERLQELQRGIIAPESRRGDQLQEQVLDGLLFRLVGVGLRPQDEEREEDVVREDVHWSCGDEVDFGCELGDGCFDCFGGVASVGVCRAERLVAVDQTGVVYCADDRVHPVLYVFPVGT